MMVEIPEPDILPKLLTPSCANFLKKLSFFTLGEEWQGMSGFSSQECTLLKASFAAIRKEHEARYYHTLFHLLTCSSCIDRAPEILLNKSHPQLWKLGVKHPGEYLHIVQQPQNSKSEKLRYFQLLYKKLVAIKQAGILFKFRKNNVDVYHHIVHKLKAAGISEETPPSISVPDTLFCGHEKIELDFDIDPIDNSLCVGFQGGSAKTRSMIQMEFFYYDQPPDKFYGKEIIAGGMWIIDAKKAKNICYVNFEFQDNTPGKKESS